MNTIASITRNTEGIPSFFLILKLQSTEYMNRPWLSKTLHFCRLSRRHFDLYGAEKPTLINIL
jgi:hypothetical protein